MARFLKRFLGKLRRSRLVENTFWMLGGYGGRFLTQGLYFFVLARTLGAEGLGTFAAGLAFVTALSPFSGMGSGEILIKKASRKTEDLQKLWGTAILKTSIGATALMVLSVASSPVVIGVGSKTFVATVGLAELYFNRLVTTAGQVFQAVERMKITAYIYTASGATRLLAVVFFHYVIQNPTASLWAYWFLGANVASTIIAVCVVTWYEGLPILRYESVCKDIKQGLYFSLGLSSRSIYNDADKTMLKRLDTSLSSGLYTAAYRVVSAAFTPVRALLATTYVKFFKVGKESHDKVSEKIKKTVIAAVVYGATVWGLIYIVAPILPYILGKDFRGSVQAVRMLGVLPTIQAVHFVFGNGLDGIDRQDIRGRLQVGAALLNVALNFPMILMFSWRGAVFTTITTEFLLGGVLAFSFYKCIET